MLISDTFVVSRSGASGIISSNSRTPATVPGQPDGLYVTDATSDFLPTRWAKRHYEIGGRTATR